MKKYMFHFLYIAILAGSIYTVARGFRAFQAPHAHQFTCGACHTSKAGGGPRNDFGKAIEDKFLDSQGNVIWNSELAKLDSDGDGFTNGQELQDPEGKWRIGQPLPGDSTLATNPGDKNSFPNPTSVKILAGLPKEYNLSNNYPNPFNPTTKIKFSIPALEKTFVKITLKIYDVLGKQVATLVNDYKTSGNYEFLFDASNLSSGTYLYELTAGNYTSVKKMILMK